MHKEQYDLFDKGETARRIKQLVKKYAADLDGIYQDDGKGKNPLSSLSIVDFFDIVRLIPYRKDLKPIEVIARPYYILKHRALGMDCKKKSVLMASFFSLKKIPFRFIGSSRRPDKRIHHIFVQAKIHSGGSPSSKFENYDATYKNYSPEMSKDVTAWEVL
jgi:hypothetical protein